MKLWQCFTLGIGCGFLAGAIGGHIGMPVRLLLFFSVGLTLILLAITWSISESR